MAQQVEIAGVLFNNVPYIQCPDGNGVYHQFLDTTIPSNAASASDIAQGKLAYVNGSLVTGTNQGGGSGGLEYETGTWTPATDSTGYFINFANSHTSAPFFYAISCTSAFVSSSSSGVIYMNLHQAMNEPLHTSASGLRYGYAQRIISSGSSSTTNITYPYTNQGDSSASYSRYWAKETGINAPQYSSGYPWRAGSTYKWIAVWVPTS